MVIKMRNTKYNKIADTHKAQETKTRNALIAFIVGGLIGVLAELIIEVLCECFHISRSEASTFMIIIFIFVASLSTALGFFDKLVTKFKCGLLIPITGFANSIASPAIEFKSEGLVLGVGAKLFQIAGPVLVYGITSSIIVGVIYYMVTAGQ